MRIVLLACLAAGCGGDSKPTADAAVVADGPVRDAGIDALPDALTAVRRVDPCPPPGMIAQTVTTTSSGVYAFVPASITINVNDVVKFAPENIHSVIPHPTLPSDPGLRSGATGEERCLQFTMTGTFNYRCGPHASMTGVVTVN